MARVLIVDADPAVQRSMAASLEASGHNCDIADNPESAKAMLAASDIDLVLLAMDMPGKAGFEVLAIVATDAPDAAVVIMTKVGDHDSAAVALGSDAYGYVVKPFGAEIEIAVINALKRRDLERERTALLQELREKVSERSIALREVSIELARAVEDNELTEKESWERLKRTVSLRDDETGKHIERVGWITRLVADRMELSEAASAHLGMASALHDVGKIGIPDVLLLKPGLLTPEERAIVQQHSEIGYRMLSGSRSPVVSLGATIALTHHERWDGGGYPRGLVGEATPIEARITSVVDTFDAMTHRRVYRTASTVEQAVEVLTAERGKQFDADVVDALLGALDDIVIILEEHPDEEETRIRVLLAGDQPVFAETLISVFAGKEDILVVGTAGTIEDATRITREVQPDVVVLDSSLPGGAHVEAITLIKAERPATKIVCLPASDDPESLAEAIQAGCAGYLEPGGAKDQVADAIRIVHAGESIVPREKLPSLLRHVSPTRRGLGYAISDREREVLALLAEGLSTEEIAEALVLSLHTVRNHIQRIMGKLEAHSRLEAVTTAVREGVIRLTAA